MYCIGFFFVSFHYPGPGLHFYSIRLLCCFFSIELGIEFHTLNVTIGDIVLKQIWNDNGFGNGESLSTVQTSELVGESFLFLALRRFTFRRRVKLYKDWHFGTKMLWVKVNGRFAFVFSSKFTVHHFCPFLLQRFFC